MRRTVDLGRGWTFVHRRADARWSSGAEGGGDTVDLPHCWNAEDTFRPGVRARVGDGSYRKVVRLPDDARPGDNWQLVGEGFYGIGDLWIDGERVALLDGQYLGFRFAVGDRLEPGRDHVIAVRLDNRYRRGVLPGRKDPDFLLYGGLAGRVTLQCWPRLYLDPDMTHVRVERIGVDHADIEVRFALVNRLGEQRDGTIDWAVIDPEGRTVSESSSPKLDRAGPGDFYAASAQLRVERPRTWSPETPHLYEVEGRLRDEAGTIDTLRVRFGIRRAEFRSGQGFFLNGERLDLHGFNRHESLPGFGNALPPELHRRDAETLRQLGANFVRLSHYPQQPAFLDACDEQGLLVLAEIATWKSVRGRGRWLRAAKRQLRDMILRDRNRPSVILWGMGNESRSKGAYTALRQVAQRHDPDRPVIYAENHLYRARRHGTLGIPDVWGTNYELDVLPQAAAASRLGNVILTECNNHPHSERGDDAEELRQVAELERGWEMMEGREYLAGHAIWCFADYATEHRDRFRRLAGVLDAWRTPKMAAALFRARYAAAPFVSGRVVRDASGNAELHVFSNCETVRVAQGARDLAELSGALHYVVPVDSGFDALSLTGTHPGGTVEERLLAHGPAARVVITREEEPTAAGQTVSLAVRIIDTRGVTVSDWHGHVTLAVEGVARRRTYTPGGEIAVARGMGRGYVTGDGSGGKAVITAEASGLEPGRETCTFPSPHAV
jgi:beta-galactosidase